MVYDEWKKVFSLATGIAKELRAKNPKLTVAQSTKEAFKDPRVAKARAEYDTYKQKKLAGAKKKTGGAKRKTTARKVK